MMQEPSLDRMWETFIPISVGDHFSGRNLDTIRFKIYPIIDDLTKKKTIDWYCFLVHGNPKDKSDMNLYYHIRVSLTDGIDSKFFSESLPDYCLFTQPIKRKAVSKISHGRDVYLDTTPFKREKIEDAWRILGEQSEWLLNMLKTYKEDAKIPFLHVAQFFHYYFNMINLHCKCPNCKKIFRPDFHFTPEKT